MLTQESKHRRKVKQPEGSPVLSNVQDGRPPPSMESSIPDMLTVASADSAPAGASVEQQTQTGRTTSDPAQSEAPAVTDQNNVKAVSEVSVFEEEEDGDDWLNDDDTIRHIPINNDEDVSFSDLEEDDATGSAKGNK